MTENARPPARKPDHISKGEIRKDALQDGAAAAADTVGEVATILTTAVSDMVKAVGGLATEIFEIRDAARKAAQDHRVDDVDAGATDE